MLFARLVLFTQSAPLLSCSACSTCVSPGIVTALIAAYPEGVKASAQNGSLNPKMIAGSSRGEHVAAVRAVLARAANKDGVAGILAEEEEKSTVAQGVPIIQSSPA